MLLTAFFLLQTLLGSGAALEMWVAASDPLGIAESICAGLPQDATSGQRNGQVPNQRGHDHEQCLLCNVGLGAGILPVTGYLPPPLVTEAVAPMPASRPMPSRWHGCNFLARGPPLVA